MTPTPDMENIIPIGFDFALIGAEGEDDEDGAVDDSAGAADTDQDGSDAEDGEERKYPQAYVKRLREEAKAARIKAAATEARLKALEDAGKTDAQRAADKLADESKQRESAAEQKVRKLGVKYAVAIAAKDLNFTDPEDAISMLDMSDITIDDATGEPDTLEVKEALKALAKAKPYLVKGRTNLGNGDGGATGKGAPKAVTQADKVAGHRKALVDKGMIPVPGA